MNGEYYMDWACGYYDQFRHELHEGLLTLQDVNRLYLDGKITWYQQEYAEQYLKGEEND